MEKMKRLEGFKEKSKTLRIIGNSVFFTIIGFLLAFFIINTIDIRSGYNVPFFGYRNSVIVSESMATANEANDYLTPEMSRIQKYDVIVTHDYKSYEDIKLYDVITYKSNDLLVCHRVIKLYEERGNKYIVTRGDANAANDGPIMFDSVRGHVINVIPYLGHVVLFMQSGYVLIAILGTFFFVLLAMFIEDSFKYYEYKGLKGYNKVYEEDETFVLNGSEYNKSKRKKDYQLIGGDNHYLIDIDNDSLTLFRIIRTDYKNKTDDTLSSGLFPYAELDDTLISSVIPLCFERAFKGKDPLKPINRRLKEMKIGIEDKKALINEKVINIINNSNLIISGNPLPTKLQKSYDKLVKRIGNERIDAIDIIYHYLSSFTLNEKEASVIFDNSVIGNVKGGLANV